MVGFAKAGRIRRFGPPLLAIAPLLFLATDFWKPALFDHKSLIHGDAILHGLSLIDLQAHSFRHLGRLLWSDEIYGGHPLFAEGQGAFADPLNMLIGWVVAPAFGAIYAMNFFHFIAMILTGIGIVGLCKSLGASWAACSFAAVAVVFSSIWIGGDQNLTISGALAWVPWAFWTMDRWLKAPTARAAIWLGGAVAVLVLAGYPQAFHGAILYMASGLIVIPFQADARREWRACWGQRLASGGLAVLICAGLSAVQWLPLLELTRLSHRSEGIGIVFNLPLTTYLRGFLFSWQKPETWPGYFSGTGSLFVTAIAAVGLAVRLPQRVKGHAVSTIFVLQMGLERGSPLFRLLYDHDLVPGLRYFRSVSLYLDIAIIGMAVLAAFAIDGVSRWRFAGRHGAQIDGESPSWIKIWAILSIAALWAWIAVRMQVGQMGMVCLGVFVAAVAGGALLLSARRGGLILLLMIGLLVTECLTLRMHSFRFYDTAYLEKPASVGAIEAVDYWRDYRLFDNSIVGGYGFTDSRAPELPNQMRRMMESVSAMTNLMWGLRSFNGALALPLRRQVLAEARIREEIDAPTDKPAGSRLADLLAVRFITVDRPSTLPSFRHFWSDPELGTEIIENVAARPRFQLYTRHMTVNSPDEALAAIKTLKSPLLVIENPVDGRQFEPADPEPKSPSDASPGHFDIVKAKSTDYRIAIAATRPLWFFIADANYPGWTALLDGKPAPLFSAQLLGKAVAIPEGEHRLEITFESSTFLIGLGVSVISLICVASLLAGYRFTAILGNRRKSGEPI